MRRIYVPMEELEHYGVTAEELGSGVPMEKLRPLLEYQARRAREYYQSAEKLLPMVEEVSRPALWTMVEIYRGILDRIEQRNYDVYTERVRLTVGEKLKVLGRGFWKRLV